MQEDYDLHTSLVCYRGYQFPGVAARANEHKGHETIERQRLARIRATRCNYLNLSTKRDSCIGTSLCFSQ